MKQIITAKLKLHLSQDQKESVRQVCLAYRDALNYSSGIAFEQGKVSSISKLQKLVYYDIREKFKRLAQMSCNVPRQIANSYKNKWTKLKQNQQLIEQGKTHKISKRLDKPLKFTSRTCTLNYQRDFSFKTGQKVSICTLSSRVVVDYSGYSKHLEYINNGANIGASKIYYSRYTRTYYLLVSLELDVPDLHPEQINQVVGVDVGERYLAVKVGLNNGSQFFSGKEIRHKANRYHKARKSLQQKGTRSAKRRLVALSGRERRFTADVNHRISKEIAQPHTLIGLENLNHIREITRSKSGKKASEKQKKANRNKSKWALAELHSFVDYKSVINTSLAIKVPANYTSQCCPKCGHVSKENRPNQGLIFDCQSCDYKLHADLVGARNIALRALLIRQDWMSTGVLSALPDVSSDEAKAEKLQRFLELRWSLDTSSDRARSGSE
jgi:putative transposase